MHDAPFINPSFVVMFIINVYSTLIAAGHCHSRPFLSAYMPGVLTNKSHLALACSEVDPVTLSQE